MKKEFINIIGCRLLNNIIIIIISFNACHVITEPIIEQKYKIDTDLMELTVARERVLMAYAAKASICGNADNSVLNILSPSYVGACEDKNFFAGCANSEYLKVSEVESCLAAIFMDTCAPEKSPENLRMEELTGYNAAWFCMTTTDGKIHGPPTFYF